MSRISRTLQVALVVICTLVLLFGIAARLILAFTPLWLDVATIVAVPFALLVLHFCRPSPPQLVLSPRSGPDQHVEGPLSLAVTGCSWPNSAPRRGTPEDPSQTEALGYLLPWKRFQASSARFSTG